MKRIVFLLLLLAEALYAQDAQMSQFYAAPLYHNPAFTGSTFAPRVIFNNRNQWPSLDGNFFTSMLSADVYVEGMNSGFGFLFMNDQAGSNRLKTTEISFLYSYQLQLNENNAIRLGLQGGYSQRSFNSSGLIFGDQLDNLGNVIGPTQDPLLNIGGNKSFADFGAGLLYYNPKVFLGFSVAHLTEPDMALTGTGFNLPRRYVVNGGLNLNLTNPGTTARNARKELILTPTFLFKAQGPFSQLDFGAYATYAPITFGLWYRGIPLKRTEGGLVNQDALTGLVGLRFDSFSLGYSYDLTISSLGISTGGAHEISIAYQFEPLESRKKPRYKYKKKELSCPRF